jgi:nicotinamidase-related amidase
MKGIFIGKDSVINTLSIGEQPMNADKLIEQSRPFLEYVADWKESLQPLDLASTLEERPERAAIISVDVINGFCYEGPLASPRVANIVEPIVALFKRAHELEMRHFILTQDTHDEGAVEFGSYPPHCVRGSSESETVPEFKALPFFDEFIVMPKNSIDSSLNTDLNPWLEDHPEVDIYIAVGDCTDLCTYQLAMHLRLRANALNRQARIIVPEDCVDTYHLPVDTAVEIDGVPHDADLLHHIFLYSMMLNGVEVVSRVK